MIKAVFLDYTGTTVQESGADLQELIRRVCKNSNLKDPKAVVAMWWKYLKEYEEKSYGSFYLTEDEIVDKLLVRLRDEIRLQDNLTELHSLVQSFWVSAPLFPDAKVFLQSCPVPVYIISNNGIPYIEKSLRQKGIPYTGIVCADMVQAYKPHRELFDKALGISGCHAEEVIHIGDSYSSDVLGARSAQIRPILIQRDGGQEYKDVTVIRSLSELLSMI